MKLSFDELVDRLVQYQNQDAILEDRGVSSINPDDEPGSLLSILTSTGDAEPQGAGMVYTNGHNQDEWVGACRAMDFGAEKLSVFFEGKGQEKAVEVNLPEHLMFRFGVLLINTAIFSNHARRNPGLYQHGPKPGDAQ